MESCVSETICNIQKCQAGYMKKARTFTSLEKLHALKSIKYDPKEHTIVIHGDPAAVQRAKQDILQLINKLRTASVRKSSSFIKVFQTKQGFDAFLSSFRGGVSIGVDTDKDNNLITCSDRIEHAETALNRIESLISEFEFQLKPSGHEKLLAKDWKDFKKRLASPPHHIQIIESLLVSSINVTCLSSKKAEAITAIERFFESQIYLASSGTCEVLKSPQMNTANGKPQLLSSPLDSITDPTTSVSGASRPSLSSKAPSEVVKGKHQQETSTKTISGIEKIKLVYIRNLERHVRIMKSTSSDVKIDVEKGSIEIECHKNNFERTKDLMWDLLNGLKVVRTPKSARYLYIFRTDEAQLVIKKSSNIIKIWHVDPQNVLTVCSEGEDSALKYLKSCDDEISELEHICSPTDFPSATNMASDIMSQIRSKIKCDVAIDISEDKSKVLLAILRIYSDQVLCFLNEKFGTSNRCEEPFVCEDRQLRLLKVVLKECHQEIVSNDELHKLNFRAEDKLIISGTHSDVQNMQRHLTDALSKIIEDPFKLDAPASIKLFNSSTGKLMMEDIGKRTRTLISSSSVKGASAQNFSRSPTDRISKFQGLIVPFHTGKPSQLRSDDFLQHPANMARRSNVKCDLVKGLLADIQADVLVNSVSGNLKLDAGSISASLLKAAGPQLQLACKQNAPRGVAAGEMVITDGFDLKCQKVFHVHCCSWDRDQGVAQKTLRDVVQRCLKACEDGGYKSIAFPAIGSGNLGFPRDQVASIMTEAVTSYTGTGSSLQVMLVVFLDDDEMYQAFQEQMCGVVQRSSPRKSVPMISMPKIKRYARTTPEPEKEFTKIEPLNLLISGLKRENINDAKSRLKTFINESILTKSFTEESHKEMIGQLSDAQREYLHRYASQSHLELELNTTRKQLSICGLREDVTLMCDLVKEEFRKIEKADWLLQREAEWQVERGGKWTAFGDKLLNLEIDARYKKLPTSTYKHPDGQKIDVFYIDFSIMEAWDGNNTWTGKVRRLDKIKGEVTQDLPSHWSGDEAQVTVDPVSQEYHDVVKGFEATLAQTKTVVKVKRIQNTHLYKQYQIQKEKVQSTLTSGVQVERVVWHGTKVEHAEAICKTGFNRSYAGQNGVMYGKGSYFATNSDYSVRYSQPDIKRQQYMIRARIISGEFCIGNSSMSTPPYKPSSHDHYNSTVDDAVNPSIFVVYHDTAAYPEYIIIFR